MEMKIQLLVWHLEIIRHSWKLSKVQNLKSKSKLTLEFQILEGHPDSAVSKTVKLK